MRLMKFEETSMIKRFKQAALSLAMSGMMAGAAPAAELTIPTTFAAGDPALAADMNANFAAVKTSVDDNNSRIAQLEAMVASHLGVNITNASLSGTYTTLSLETGVQGGADNYAASTVGRWEGNLTFDGVGGFQIVDVAGGETEQTMLANSDLVNTGVYFKSTQSSDSTLESASGSYSITPSGALTLTFPDGTTEIMHMTPDMSVGSGNNLYTETLSGGETRKNATLYIIIKQTD